MSIQASKDSNSISDEASPSRQRPRLLFMGLRRSGKSSILNVVLYKMPPTETVFIATTVVIKKHNIKSYRTFSIWDLPGQIDFTSSNYDTEGIFGPTGAIVWVLDAQDNYIESVSRLVDTVISLQQSRSNIKFAVFIHKTDSISDDYREDTVRDIQQRVIDDLDDAAINPTNTTHFEALINNIAVNCRFQKLYLFDTLTKLYISSDTSPGDTPSYSLLSDWFDTLMDLADLYSMEGLSTQVASGDALKIEDNFLTSDSRGTQNGVTRPGTTMSTQAPPNLVESDAHSFVKGSRGIDLYLQEVTVQLVLIGWSKQPGFAERKPLIDYNVSLFSKAVKDCLSIIAPDPPEIDDTQQLED